MRCGEHNFVPLLGMHGMAAYSPSRVVRQYGLVQPVPMVEDMSAWFFDFTASNSKEQVKKGQRLWQLRRYEDIPMGEGDDKVHNYKAYRDYHLWIEASLDKNPGMVEDENPPPPNPCYRDYLTESSLLHQKIQRLWMGERDSLIKEQQELEERNQMLTQEVQRLEHRLMISRGRIYQAMEIFKEVGAEANQIVLSRTPSFNKGEERKREENFISRLSDCYRVIK